MSKHTNGPWMINDTGHVTDKFDSLVADAYKNEDAQLIAAAPELLEAAAKAERDISDLINAGAVHDQDAKLLRSTIKALTDAINKAEGK